MIREVTLYPAAEVSIVADSGVGVSRDPGSSDYPWDNSPTYSLAETWSDGDPLTRLYMWPHKDNGGSAVILASFDPPPTLALYRKVTLRATWDYSKQGANTWIFPPTNANGPRARGVLRNRAKDGNNVGAWYEIAGSDITDRFQNINTGSPGSYLGPLTQEWELTAHPEGGPFTIDDLSPSNLAAGIEINAAAPAYDATTGSFAKIRVPSLVLILEVEDLGGYVRNMRHHTAMDARLWRRARNVVHVRVPVHRAVGSVGSVVSLCRPGDAPSVSGSWGIRPLEMCSGQVLRRSILMEVCQVEDEIFDRRAFACLLWAAYRIDSPWSPELQGLCYLDKGTGYTHTRSQDGWSSRPVDGVLMRVLEGSANLSREGLACQGGGDVELCLYNWDMMQAGWSTVGDSGDFAATADTAVSLVEEQGYLSSCRLAYGATGGAGGRTRSLGTLPYASGELIHTRVRVKNTSVVTPSTQFAEWSLRRTGGGLAADEYWDAAGRDWTTTPTYNAIPSSEPSGESLSDAIPCDAAGASSDPTYHVAVGRFSAAMGPATIHGASVCITRGGYGAGTPLVTLGSQITREADVHEIANDASAEVWGHGTGTIVAEAKPFWRAADLPDDDVRPLLHALHEADTWQALQFVAKTATDDLVRFESAVSGETTFQLDCPITDVDITRDHVLRAWARWLADEAWTEYGPYSVEVGYAVFLRSTGALVSTGSVLGKLAYTGAVTGRDYVRVGCDASRSFDGRVRMIEVRRNPLHRLEAIWRV